MTDLTSEKPELSAAATDILAAAGNWCAPALHRVKEWSARGIVLSPTNGRLHDPELLDDFLRRARVEFPGEMILVTEHGELRVTHYEDPQNAGPHLDWHD